MALLIIFFLLSILVSFLCSIWEAVLLSVTPAYIKRLKNDGGKSGALLERLKQDIDKPLSAILTLNTIAHTVGAIGVGAESGKLFASQEWDLFGLAISMESVIATVMTLAILFLSEIIPKTIGANNWTGLAPFTARSLNFLMLILGPFVWISNRLTRLLKNDKGRSVFSKQDFAALAEVGAESGNLPHEDFRLIKNVLEFDELKAKDVMTPRPVMVMAEQNTPIGDFYAAHKKLIFSRIPLFEQSKDKVVGIFLKDELLQAMVEGKKEAPLLSLVRPVIFIPEELSLRTVFERLRKEHQHIAMVVDEYGAVQGLLTLEDIIETLFGLEIMDETDSVSDLQVYAREKWEERARKMGLIE